MKQFSLFLICAGALGAATADDDRVATMLNEKLTVAQRNDACFALRGNRSPEVISAMRGALASQPVRPCASRNLRAAGAIDEFREPWPPPAGSTRGSCPPARLFRTARVHRTAGQDGSRPEHARGYQRGHGPG